MGGDVYGPGQPPAQQGYPAALPEPPVRHGAPTYPGQGYGPQPQLPGYQQPPTQQAQWPAYSPQGDRRRNRPRAGFAVFATVFALAATGAVNAGSAPMSFLHEQFLSLWLVGGDPLFLAAAQGATGVACLAFGILLLTRQPFAWGGALVSALGFGLFEAYCITRGVAEHFVGLFLVVVVIALLNQPSVRRFCNVGPPAK